MQRQSFGRSGLAREAMHVRSLLSGKALEDNLSVRIDAEVLDGVGVGTLAIASTLHGGSIAKSREGVTAEGLHDDDRSERGGSKQEEAGREERGEGGKAEVLRVEESRV